MLRVRTNISGLIQGPGVSTFHFEGDDSTVAQAASTATKVFWEAVRGKITAGITISGDTEVANVNEATGHQAGIFTVTPWSTVTNGGVSPCPHAVNGLVTWRTGVFYDNPDPTKPSKELKGRTFIPLPDIGQLSNGAPITAYVTALNAAAAALIADSSCELMVYSKVHAAASTVTSGSTWSKFAVLRSRRD